MPRGIPTLGLGGLSRSAPATDTPQSEVLGVVDPNLTNPAPESQQETAYHADVEITDPPPPWELTGEETASDARKFVDVPANWTLRWINPRLLESMGWRHWQPVMASDPRVKVHVKSLIGPDNNIRRGAQTGDVLAWMLTSWVESRRRLRVEAAAKLAQSAVDRQQALKEQFERGNYGPYIHLERAQHPTHTMGEGKSMRD